MLTSMPVPRLAELAVVWLQGLRKSRPEDAPPLPNPFLQGIFAPIDRETTAENLSVQGQLPVALRGLYLRTGPNPLKAPRAADYHWFMGDGMVHGLRLQDGQAKWYRSRWVGSDEVNKALGRPVLPGKRRGLSGVVNTNVFGHAGRIWAATEAGVLPIELDAQLNSVRHGLFDSKLTLPYSAHPHLDPITGDLHAICYHALAPWVVRYMRVNAEGRVDRVVSIPVKHGPMIHDCAITASKVIVLDLPVTLSPEMIKEGASFPYAWNDRHPARVGLLPRDGQEQDIRWLDVDPCYVFHPCNAYDMSDGTVVLDVVVHERMFVRSKVGPELDGKPRFERWTLPAGGTRVQRQVVHDASQEFPRFDERLAGRPYRYAYAVCADFDQPGGQRLYKHDLQAMHTTAHAFGAHLTPGEFVFVPREAHSAEDDGWLMGLVHNHQTNCGELHVLDARDMAAPAVAVVRLPVRVPMGFHGNWVADASADAARAPCLHGQKAC